MKKLFNSKILLILLLSMFASAASAHDIEVKNADGVKIYYSWINNYTELEVSFRGDKYNSFENEYSGNVVIPESVTYNGNTYRVTSIGEGALASCGSVTSVTMPNSVNSIGWMAFMGCGMYNITISNNVTAIPQNAFTGCWNLQAIIFPNGVTSIGREAFSWSRIQSVTFPNSLILIDYNAFEGCYSLNSVISDIKNPFQIQMKGAFEESSVSSATLTVPAGTKEDYVAAGWNFFKEIIEASGGSSEISKKQTIHVATAGTLPNLISESAREIIEDLTLTGEINGTDLKLIREMAGCPYLAVTDDDFNYTNYRHNTDGKLTVLDLSGVKIKAGGESYYGESYNDEGRNGTTYYIDNNDELPSFAFFNSRLTSFIAPSSVKSIGNNAFSHNFSLRNISNLTSVTTVGDLAFYSCSSLPLVAIPNNVKTIGSQAFYGCTSITSVSFSKNVTSIGDFAFADCSHLTSIYFPNMATSIGSWVFYGCPSLTTITSEIESPNSFDDDVFDSAIYSNVTLTVPKGKKSLYQSTAGWKNFKNIVEVGGGQGGEIGEKFEYEGIDYWIVDNNSVDIYSGYGQGDIVIPSQVSYNGKTYDVKYIGSEAFFQCSGLTSVTIPNSVTFIGDKAFIFCSDLTSVTIPNSVVSIGDNAFFGTPWYDNQPDGVVYAGKVLYCFKGTMPVGTKISLEEGTLGIAGNAFYGCKNLESVTIPNSVTTIEYGAFYGCSGLTSVTIPNSVISIGGSAFYGCSGLTSVISEIKNPFMINDDVFESTNNVIYTNTTLSVPAGTKSAYQSTAGWKNFKNIVEAGSSEIQKKRTIHVAKAGTLSDYISESEKFLIEELTLTGEINGTDFRLLREMSGRDLEGDQTNGRLAVLDLSGVKIVAGGGSYYIVDIDIAHNLEYDDIIPPSVFAGCSSLTSITIPNSVTSIGSGAFFGCSSLTSMIIPKSVTSIEGALFSGCSSLTSISVEPDNSVYNSRDNCNAIIETKSNTLIAGCKAATIPYSVTSIGDWAFDGCSGLTSITIPSNVTSIGNYSFSYCDNLKTVTIPNSVTSIGFQAFIDCKGLASVISEIQNPFEIGNNVFYSYNPDIYATATLTVPAGTKAKYQSTDGWKKFQNIVEAAGDEVEFTIDGVTYHGYKSEKTALVKAVNTSLNSVEIPASVNYDGTTYTVTGIDDHAFDGSTMAALVWNIESAIPSNAFSNASIGSNYLLYVKSASYAPSTVRNVVVDGKASSITLSDDGGQFYCPKSFNVQKISYSHHYSMETGGNGKGWETIALPYGVETITHATRGEIVPFAAYSQNSGKKPFWLCKFGSNGFVRTNSIQAYTPYIIAMPNQTNYDNNYILAGEVTFTSENVTVAATPTFSGTFVPTLSTVPKATNVYALNVVNRYVSQTGGYDAGSKFISNLRDVRPFEAYISDSSTRGIIDINMEDSTTSMDGVLTLLDPDREIDIYTLSGQKIKRVRQSDLHDTLEQLPHGVYIVNGQKVLR